MQKEKEDCVMKLISLVGKPRLWREEASKVMIEHYQDMKSIKKELKLLLTVNTTLLTIAIAVATKFFLG